MTAAVCPAGSVPAGRCRPVRQSPAERLLHSRTVPAAARTARRQTTPGAGHLGHSLHRRSPGPGGPSGGHQAGPPSRQLHGGLAPTARLGRRRRRRCCRLQRWTIRAPCPAAGADTSPNLQHRAAPLPTAVLHRPSADRSVTVRAAARSTRRVSATRNRSSGTERPAGETGTTTATADAAAASAAPAACGRPCDVTSGQQSCSSGTAASGGRSGSGSGSGRQQGGWRRWLPG